MAGLRPTAADLETRPIWPRSPWHFSMPLHVPKSRAIYRPAMLPENMEVQTQWSPYGTFEPRPFFGGYDPIGFTHVPQADLYDVSPNPWPAHGANAGHETRPVIIVLPPSTSHHRGFQMPTKRGDPTAVFVAPPSYAYQTVPIPALGI